MLSYESQSQIAAKPAAVWRVLIDAGAWPSWVLGNHDRHRIASRVGPAQARVAAVLLLTLRGTPTLYYGDEIGMTDVPIPPDRVQDPFERNVPGLGLGRDPERTPMQWSAAPNAGFTAGTPWLPVAADYRETNVETQRRDPAFPPRLGGGFWDGYPVTVARPHRICTGFLAPSLGVRRA